MVNWSATFGPRTGTAGVNPLSRAKARTFSRKLDQSDAFKFDIPGKWRYASGIAPLETDVWLYREGVKVQRLRVMPQDDNVDATTVRSTFTAQDYRELLNYRYTKVGDTLTYTAVDQAQIVWNLIQLTQGRSGGALGITATGRGFTAGAGSTGVVRDRTYDTDKEIGQLIDELSAVINGFDWWIDADLKLNVGYPQRGLAGVVVETLQYGGNVSAFRRTFAPSTFANATAQVGGQDLPTVYATAADVATDPRGRWEYVASDAASVTDTTTLTQKAQGALALRDRDQRGWTVTLRRNRWRGFGHIDVGDVVRWVAKAGAASSPLVNVNVLCRVTQIDVAIGESGQETVTMALESTT